MSAIRTELCIWALLIGGALVQVRARNERWRRGGRREGVTVTEQDR